MNITAFDLAQRFVGLQEVGGAVTNPQIAAFLQLDNPNIVSDEVPWCSAFVNWVSWLLRLPRSKSLAARSNLNVGTPIDLNDAKPGFDICIFWRDSLTAKTGHVGFYAGRSASFVLVLGGDQGNKVSIEPFPIDQLLGVRRLASE